MSTYLLSYTAISLSAYESEVMAELYLSYGGWEQVMQEVVEGNVLQKGSQASRKRLFNELQKRLATLTPAQMAFYRDASGADSRNLAMLSCFKLYRFIYDFATEVMRRKLLLFDFHLLDSDYESFYDSKRVAYNNLNTVSEATQRKLRQVMFRMFEQAGLIDSTKSRNIQKPYLSEELLKLIVEDNPGYLSAFLYSDSDIDMLKARYG